jgi:hypothetical protein
MDKKSLDIGEIIAELKRIVSEAPVVSGGARFYGKVSIYFEDGHVNHIEKFETIR